MLRIAGDGPKRDIRAWKLARPDYSVSATAP